MTPEIPIVLLHIPHSSRTVPPEVRKSILLADTELDAKLTKMTDAYTDDLFIPESLMGNSVVFPISHLAVDPERFLDDDQEIMAQRGMGVIYIKTSDGKDLRKLPSAKQRLVLIDRY